MTTHVETVRPDDSVAVARELFRRRRFRHVPVVAAGRLVGIVSDRDLRGVTDDTTTIDAVMTPAPATTTPGAPIEKAATLMHTRKIGALPVLEGDTLVGIVSESDLLVALVALLETMDPTTVLDLECDDDSGAPHRIRQLIERHGGTVLWLTAIRAKGGRQQISLRVRMPLAFTPSQMLEEAGFTVTSCLVGRAATLQ